MTVEKAPRGKPVRFLLAVLTWVAAAGSANWLGIVVQRKLNADGHYLINDSLELLPQLIPVAVLLVVLPQVATGGGTHSCI